MVTGIPIIGWEPQKIHLLGRGRGRDLFQTFDRVLRRPVLRVIFELTAGKYILHAVTLPVETGDTKRFSRVIPIQFDRLDQVDALAATKFHDDDFIITVNHDTDRRRGQRHHPHPQHSVDARKEKKGAEEQQYKCDVVLTPEPLYAAKIEKKKNSGYIKKDVPKESLFVRLEVELRKFCHDTD